MSDRVSDQLLQICCRNSARAALPLSLAIFLTQFLLSNRVDNTLLGYWTLASCSAVLLRVILLRYVSRQAALKPLRKRQFAILLTLILGCTIASVFYFFKYVGTFERAMLTAIVLGLCTASHSTNFGYRPLLLSYIGPLLGTLAILWMFNLDQLVHPLMAFCVGASVLIVGNTLLTNGRFMFDAFALSIESSIQLEEQSSRLSEALHIAEQAKLEAEASSQSKTRFIAAASHDLRQPVHVLNLFGAALKHASLDDKSRDIVENMNIAVTSLSSQLNALLDISELDSGAIKPQVRSVDLYLLTATLVKGLSKLAEDKKIQLINDVPESVFVRTDPAMLSQIMRNLCGNAIKYTHTGHVRLAAVQHADEVILSIEDTGIGIEDTHAEKVFEEFYQIANPGRDKGHGLGLGLSIVERLIRNLGHSMDLESRVGEGTQVTIRMQRCTHDQVSTARTPLAAESVMVTLPDGFHVHLVDDEEPVRQSLKACLNAAGCRVTLSENSHDAINWLKHNSPSALLVDLRLQNGDSGMTVIDHVMVSYPELPMALITGETLSDGSMAEQYPGLLMLQKPVSNEALLELLDYMVVTTMESTTTLLDESQVNSAERSIPAD